MRNPALFDVEDFPDFSGISRALPEQIYNLQPRVIRKNFEEKYI